MVKVAIIVPVYKTEKYLERCVSSIRNQTLKDIQIVLVDDESPDSCPQICDKLAKEDSRILVVHQRNQGLAGARNAGLEVVFSQDESMIPEYIGFVDSDDYVDSGMYERMYKNASEQNVDLIMCDFLQESSDTAFICSKSISEGLYDEERIKKEIFPQLIMREDVDYGPLLSVWCCLYRAEFLFTNKIKFDQNVKLSEDNLFNSVAGFYAKKFYYLKGFAPYHYIYNPNSLSHSFKPFAWDAFCRMNQELRRQMADSEFDFSRQFDLHMLYYTLSCVTQVSNGEFGVSEKFRMVKKCLSSAEVRNAMHGFRIPENINWKLKVIVFFIKHNFPLLLLIVEAI